MQHIKESLRAKRKRALHVLKRLQEEFPDIHCTLNHDGPLQLLIGTILAAQCTDVRVNIVTQDLFRKYRTVHDFAHAKRDVLEEDIRPCGFYKNKAKSIQGMCKMLLERYDGTVPGTMSELLKLPGVGRKTANVILAECFDTPGIIVDTHCGRLVRRLGFTTEQDPTKVENALAAILPKEVQALFSHLMVFHGRKTCQARKPACDSCVVADLCPRYL